MSEFEIFRKKSTIYKKKIRGKSETKNNEEKKRSEKANKWTSEVTKELSKRKINPKKKLEAINLIKQGRKEFLEQGKLSPEFIRTLKRFFDNLY